MDPIRLYLKDIKKIPLLTAAEEIQLSKRTLKGDAQARRQIIISNLRLVISIAKRYNHLGVPLLDLIEEGNLGLMKAVTKYNPRKGYRFSTYAAWWIRQYITRAIANQGTTVRIPVYMTELMSRWRRATEVLTQRHGRKPTGRELSAYLHLPIERVRRLHELTSTTTASLEAPVGEEGTAQVKDLIEDTSSPAPSEEITQLLEHEHIDTLLQKMNERERKILVLRYGLEDGVSRTLGETAKSFGITRERVRQIEQAAMKKLRVMLQAEGEGPGR